MTGFGRGAATHDGRRYVVEIKSLNNRYCEVSVSAPRDFLELEHQLHQAVKTEFSRGKFELHLKVENERLASSGWIDETVLAQRWKALEAIRKKVGAPQSVGIESLLSYAKAGTAETQDVKAASKAFLEAAKKAMAQLRSARGKEGKGLGKVLLGRLESVERALDHIQSHIPQGQEERKTRFFWKLDRILEEKNLDRRRVETEIALLIEKADVSEEIDRFALHLKRFSQMVRGKGPTGREMDFVIQEMNREINTIGSKTQDPHVSEEVIFVKAELEKIREQVQNIE